jgi:hypothetical protein
MSIHIKRLALVYYPRDERRLGLEWSRMYINLLCAHSSNLIDIRVDFFGSSPSFHLQTSVQSHTLAVHSFFWLCQCITFTHFFYRSPDVDVHYIIVKMKSAIILSLASSTLAGTFRFFHRFQANADILQYPSATSLTPYSALPSRLATTHTAGAPRCPASLAFPLAVPTSQTCPLAQETGFPSRPCLQARATAFPSRSPHCQRVEHSRPACPMPRSQGTAALTPTASPRPLRWIMISPPLLLQ